MRLLRWISSTVALALVGCGGGGSGESPELTLGALTPSTLSATLTDIGAGQRPQLTLSASYTGTASGTVYVLIDDPDRVITAAVPAVGEGRASLTLDIGTAPAPGRYAQPLVIRVCKDAACTREYAGSPQTVRKDILIESLEVGASSLSFAGPVGVGAAAQSLAVTPPAGKTYEVSPLYVEFRAPGGSSALLAPETVFDITRTATGLQIKPKAAAAGRYTWPMTLITPGYKTKVVDVAYDVAGTSVPALTLLNTTLAATLAEGTAVLADVDVLVNMPFTEMRITTSGNPDPSATGWLLYHSTESFTYGTGPADNARHVRFKFDRCGYGGAFGCLATGTYTASVQIDVVAFGETWTYIVPATFTIP